MKKVLLGTAVALLSSSVAFAQDYQFQVGAAYMMGDDEGTDVDGFALNGQFHFEKVDTSKGPLGEAAFLDKSSYVDLTWMTLEADVSGADSEDTILLGGRFVTDQNLIVEAGYGDVDGDETIINLGVGTYLNDNTDVVVTYQNFDEADYSSLSVDSHSVKKLSGEASLAYDLGLAYVDANDESGYQLSAGADYYLNKALSFGASLSLLSIDEYDESTLGLNATYFATPVLELGLDYASSGQDADADMLALSAAFRF